MRLLLASIIRRYLCVESIIQNTASVQDAMKHWEGIFLAQNVSEPENSIKNIMAHVLSLHKPIEVETKMDVMLSPRQVQKYHECCECRLANMPVQYIIKEWDFRNLTLMMRAPVFIPRPETEDLVEIVKKNSNNPSRLLEVGCGSGPIVLSLLQELPELTALAIDRSQIACQLTLENAKKLQLDDRIILKHASLDSNGLFSPDVPLEGVDLIVSNPPYILTNEIVDLQPEIRIFEDHGALDGGEDGMKIISPLLYLACNTLPEGGSMFLEIDPRLLPKINESIDAMCRHKNISLVNTFKDFNGLERFVHIQKGKTII